MLRLKMVVSSVKKVANGEGNIQSEELSLAAVYGPDGSANKQWSQYTPCGQLNFTVSNPEAFGKVLPGQFIFVDLSLTDKDAL